MAIPDLRTITQDVSLRLKALQNGTRAHVDETQSYVSPATVYVFVAIDDAGGKSSLDVLRMFESVEREANDRFCNLFATDILLLPSRPASP